MAMPCLSIVTPENLSPPLETTKPIIRLSQDDQKKLAARTAVDLFVKPGMVIGLGTGSTATHAVDRIAELFHQKLLHSITCIPTSTKTHKQALSLGLPLASLEDRSYVDVSIDGADEVDEELNLVKGRGGSLLREKMVESCSGKFVVVVDESKLVNSLGVNGGGVPVEVVPFGWNITRDRLKGLFGCKGELRKTGETGDRPFVTDNGNYVVDLWFEREFGDLRVASDEILRLPGVVDHGLFLGMAHVVVVADGLGGLTFKTK